MLNRLKSVVRAIVTGLSHILMYLKARTCERSTWAAISGGVVGAAALPSPWSYVFLAAGILGALTPTSGGVS